ncbi:MAG TPA: hypothetical protein VNZ23_07925 [Xanthobacteraceae bacterium]|nr:hypothetical protein [Xanthobacteraceae bacterium]
MCAKARRAARAREVRAAKAVQRRRDRGIDQLDGVGFDGICIGCGHWIGLHEGQSTRRYCGSACRQRAYRKRAAGSAD